MASDIEEPFVVDFISGVDGMPGLAQAKMAYQRYRGDDEGADDTNKRFWTYSLGASQFASLQDVYSGRPQRAAARQKHFLDGVSRMLKAIPESMPVLGHFIGGVHVCVGNRDHGKHVMKRATRSCCVIAPGFLIGSAGIAVGVTANGVVQTAMMTAAAGVGGVAAGMQADVRLFLRGIPPQVGMSPGERFDLLVLRILDGLKSVTCMDLVSVLCPDAVQQASVWNEPLSAQEVAHLMTGIKQWPVLQKLDSGALHSFVVIKTAKGHVLLTERLHDGQIVLGDATSPSIQHFADGQTVFTDSRAMMTDGNTAMPAMAVRMHMAEQNGASLFAVKEITGGPSTAALANFARAQSGLGYDLLTSNCQHYASSILEFASGKGLTYLPNSSSLALSSLLMPPSPAAPFASPGLFGTLAYEASQAPMTTAIDFGIIACPRALPAIDPVIISEQLPLPELQRQLEQMSLQQREQLSAEQLQQLATAAASQAASQAPQMQGRRLYESDSGPTQAAAVDPFLLNDVERGQDEETAAATEPESSAASEPPQPSQAAQHQQPPQPNQIYRYPQ